MNNNYEDDSRIKVIDTRKDSIDKINEKIDNIVNSESHDEFSKKEITDYNSSAMLCYLPFICIYFILTNAYKKSEYLKFHCNQGLIVTCFYIITYIFNKTFGTISFINFIGFILYFICILLSLFGIINTNNRESKEIPIIGKIKLIKK